MNDPTRVAAVMLSVALQARAEAIYIEPSEEQPSSYAIAFVRGTHTFARQHLDAPFAAAVIARLAIMAKLDLVGAHVSTGVVRLRAGLREADAVMTLRTGMGLRAEIVLAPRSPPPTIMTRDLLGPEPGQTIGNYRVVRFLGEGGMGVVYRVEHNTLGRAYALKVLRQEVMEHDPLAAERFLREARGTARIRHPNIVDVFDYGTLEDGRPYFVMELLEGHSLADQIEKGALAPTEALKIARQLATALGSAHDRGVVHADVTPSNVLLVNGSTDQQCVKLVDFGLAEISGESLGQVEDSGFVMGTPAYISPEQLRGLPPTHRTDQYGMGAVLYELLTGRPPYEHENLATLCMMHFEAPLPAINSPSGPVSPKLTALIHTCLQKDPLARFPNMRAFMFALDDVEQLMTRRGWRRWLSS